MGYALRGMQFVIYSTWYVVHGRQFVLHSVWSALWCLLCLVCSVWYILCGMHCLVFSVAACGKHYLVCSDWCRVCCEESETSH